MPSKYDQWLAKASETTGHSDDRLAIIHLESWNSAELPEERHTFLDATVFYCVETAAGIAATVADDVDIPIRIRCRAMTYLVALSLCSHSRLPNRLNLRLILDSDVADNEVALELMNLVIAVIAISDLYDELRPMVINTLRRVAQFAGSTTAYAPTRRNLLLAARRLRHDFIEALSSPEYNH